MKEAIDTHRLISIFHAAVLFATGLCLIVIAKTAFPQTHEVRTLSYQGVLQLSNRERPADGDSSITAYLFTDERGQNVLWQDTYLTHLQAGVFNLALGSGERELPSAAELDRPLWVGIQMGIGEVMMPLTRLSASPYALAVADHTISASKMATDYISSIAVEGSRISTRGGLVNLTGGKGITLGYDPATSSVIVSNSSSTSDPKHGQILKKLDNPMTGYGDMIYGDDDGAGLRLAGNASTTKKFLHQTGTGTASAAPQWSALVANDIPHLENLNGDLTVAKGGTGSTTLTTHGILIGHGTSVVTASSLADGELLIGASGGDPQSETLSGTANRITVTNGAGSITLSTPQDIASTSSPAFANITLSGSATTHGVTLTGTSSPLSLNGSTGTTGQVLTSNGTGTPAWTAVPTATIPSGAILTMSNNNALSGYTSLNYEIIAPNSGWTQKQNMSVMRHYAMSASVNGKIYVIGGDGDFGAVDTVEQYDPSTNTWTTKASMPTARFSGACAVINNKIYVIGGQDANDGYSSVCEMYDPATNTWTTKTSMGTGRYLLGCAAVNGKLYAIGGYNGNLNPSILNTVEVYDTGTNAWAAKANLPIARYAFGCTAFAGKIYAFGGALDASYIDSTDAYDPAANLWAQRAGSSEQRYYNSCVVLDSMIYNFGGLNANGNNAANSLYNPATNAWHSIAQPNNPHVYGAAATTTSKAYLSGGGNDGVEEYDPSSEIDLYYFRKN